MAKDSTMNEQQRERYLGTLGQAVAWILAWPFVLGFNILALSLNVLFYAVTAIYFGPVVLSKVYYRQKWKERKTQPLLDV